MFENANAVIRVSECYLEGASPDMSELRCSVLSCNPEQDDIKLLLNDGLITAISLDSIYLCRIDPEGEDPLYCSITFYKRFLNKLGSVICARIIDGFTKKV